MSLTTAGAQFLAKAATGLNTPVTFAYPVVNNVGAHLGVGQGTTAFAIGQTDLIGDGGSGGKQRKACSSLTESGGVITAVTTFTTGDANFAWNEWGFFNNLSGGTMLGRKVESPGLGTKVNTQVWVLTATITFAAS